MRTTLDIACLTWAWALRLKSPKSTHTFTVLLLGLAFYAEDPDRVRNAVKIFIFLDLSLAEGIEAALVVRRWDTALDSNTLTSYTDNATLMTKQRISPIMRWEGSSKMLKQWLVLIYVILAPPRAAPSSAQAQHSCQRIQGGQYTFPCAGPIATRHVGSSHPYRPDGIQRDLSESLRHPTAGTLAKL